MLCCTWEHGVERPGACSEESVMEKRASTQSSTVTEMLNKVK